MRIEFVVIFFLLINPKVCRSQIQCNIELVGSKGETVGFASVQWNYANHKGYILTDADGGCIVQIEQSAADTIQLEIRHLSYETKVLNHAIGDFPAKIILNSRQYSIPNVVVDGEKPLISNKNDTLVFDINKIRDSTEYIVKELIEKLPGVSISEDGYVYFGNKKVGSVLIDGDDLFNSDYRKVIHNMRAQHIKGIELIQEYEKKPIYKGIRPSDALALNLKLEKKAVLTGSLDIGSGYADRALYYGNANVFLLKPKTKHVFLSNTSNAYQKANYTTISAEGTEMLPVLELPFNGLQNIPLDMNPFGTSHDLSLNSKTHVKKGHLLFSINNERADNNQNTVSEIESDFGNAILERKIESSNQYKTNLNEINLAYEHTNPALTNYINSSIKINLPSNHIQRSIIEEVHIPQEEINKRDSLHQNAELKNIYLQFDNTWIKKLNSKSLLEQRLKLSNQQEDIVIDQDNIKQLLQITPFGSFSKGLYRINSTGWAYNASYYQHSNNIPLQISLGLENTKWNAGIKDYLPDSKESFLEYAIPLKISSTFYLPKYWEVQGSLDISPSFITASVHTLYQNHIKWRMHMIMKHTPKPSTSFSISYGHFNAPAQNGQILRIPTFVDFYSILLPLDQWNMVSGHYISASYSVNKTLQNFMFVVSGSLEKKNRGVGDSRSNINDKELISLVWTPNHWNGFLNCSISKYWNRVKVSSKLLVSGNFRRNPYVLNDIHYDLKQYSLNTALNLFKNFGRQFSFFMTNSAVYTTNSLTNESTMSFEIVGGLKYKTKGFHSIVQYSLADGYSTYNEQSRLEAIQIHISKKIKVNHRISHLRIKGSLPFQTTYVSNFIQTNSSFHYQSSISDPLIQFSLDFGF